MHHESCPPPPWLAVEERTFQESERHGVLVVPGALDEQLPDCRGTCMAELRLCWKKLTLVSQNNGLPRALPRYARAALNFKPQSGDIDPRALHVVPDEQLLPGILDDVQFPGRLLDDTQFPGGLLVDSWLQNLHVGVRCCRKN
jgi:hypothetical protein